ncbi:F-box family protein [Rhynchospora pubera]|uniref:F-box family protein n=1 Tax=Rhynchospora pubera TaxID=906938 RepID=A0AAV8C7R1_9POAL|nr:F-box family protein [Rhynchospora pubera]
MIAARELKFVWGEDKNYWKWIPLSNSRFSEGILLLEVCWLEIRAKIKCRVLSARTAYAAYLIFSMEDGANWLDTILQKSSIIMNGMTVSKHWICIEPEGSTRRRHAQHIRNADKIGPNVKVPEDRDDGWKEIEMGRFYISDGDDEDVEVKLTEVRGWDRMSGLLLQGIEFRPLKDQSAFSFPTSNLDENLIVEYKGDPDELSFFEIIPPIPVGLEELNSYKIEHYNFSD